MKWVTTILVSCVCALLGVGIVMLYSSTTQVGTKYLLLQLSWGGLGLICCIVAACVDYRQLKKISPWLLLLAGILLVLVFDHHIGIARNGARRWIGLKGLAFQPSELAKFALIVFLAHYCERYQRRMSEFGRGIAIPGAVIIAVVGLIFIEPDRGASILMTSVSACMLIIAGVRLWYAAPPIILGAVGLAYSLMHDPMRLRRIMAWLHPEENKDNVGFQAYQAMIALGSGGVGGLGLGDSRQKLGFVPEHHTDFILSIIGEELGLIATLSVLVTFIVLVLCSTIIARRATDTFGLMLASGITFMIGLQAFINIGVVTSTLPNKGMPLPFISYGGSNLLMMLVSIGLLLSVSRFATDPVKTGSNPFDMDSTVIENA